MYKYLYKLKKSDYELLFFKYILSIAKSDTNSAIPMIHATAIYAHAVEYCAIKIFSRICRPTPARYSAKYSLTSAVITLDGTLTFKAVKIYGILFGSLSF